MSYMSYEDFEKRVEAEFESLGVHATVERHGPKLTGFHFRNRDDLNLYKIAGRYKEGEYGNMQIALVINDTNREDR